MKVKLGELLTQHQNCSHRVEVLAFQELCKNLLEEFEEAGNE